MTPDESPDSGFAEELERRESARRAGRPLSPVSDSLPPEQREDLEKSLACLALLARHWAEPAGPVPIVPDKAEMPTQFDRFVIERELGRGGFGVVYLGWDPKMERRVAIKVPQLKALATAEGRNRFFREVRAMARMDHPGIVPVYEAGEAGPVCFLVSAYCDGPDLASWLRGRTTPVPARTVAEWVASLAEAVDYAHRKGVLHCDLKPANVLMLPHPTASDQAAANESDCLGLVPRLADFGLARLSEAADSPPVVPAQHDADTEELESESVRTRTGVRLGTVGYMSPEQAETGGAAVSAASDIYSLGVILYELLTGTRPFRGRSTTETLRLVRDSSPLLPSGSRPDVPRELEAICLRCLGKLPEQRYASAGALAEELRRWLAGTTGVRWRKWLPALGMTAAASLAFVLVTVLSLWDPSKSSGARNGDSPEPPNGARARREESRSGLTEAEAKALRAGRPLHWLDHDPARRTPRWVLGAGVPLELADKSFAVQTFGGLLEVCRDVDLRHFRFRAEVQHLRSDGLGHVGLYFGHRTIGRDHCYCVASFSDRRALFPNPNPPGPKVSAVRLFHFCSRGEDIHAFISELGKPIAFEPKGIVVGPAPWRKLEIEVAKQGITVRWEGKAGETVPWKDYADAVHFVGRQKPEWLVLPTSPRPEQGVGLFASKAEVAYRNVVIEPIP